MLIALVQLLGGLILLVWGADRLVAGASVTARNLGVTPMVIGLTIVAYGTSAPELVVSLVASYQGQAGLAVGNVIGSNIANIGLILGVTALVHPLRVESATLKREYPQLLVIMLICLFMAWNLEFSRMEGFILLGGLVALTWVMVWLGKVKEPEDPLAQEFAAEIPVNMPTRHALLWIVVGLLVLPLASHFLVQGSLTIARALHVSETVIGLTIVAIGTSLPEFATSLTSALRKEDDLAIGNVIGSNMFNVLGVLGAAAVTRPLAFDPGILRQDIPVMLLFTVLLFFLAYGFRGPGRIGRRSGLLMLSLFIAYLYMVWSLAESAPGVSIG
jgi:cation:H+ antiporter